MARVLRLLPILIPVARRLIDDPRVRAQVTRVLERYRSSRPPRP